MTDRPRLIEVAFPLEQASLDSVHEKTLKYGHISSLHLWPARRPLAASRAALIATLLSDPGTHEGRKQLLDRIGGRVVKKIERKTKNGKASEVEKKETVGGVLHWGRESAPDMDYFRDEIRKAYGGRAPRFLDPFAGGGAIPLEAMRLGCEVTAIDINPLAWFILKCTLEYPQKLAGKKRPLPDFILEDEDFLRDFYKAHPGLIGAGKPTKKQLETLLFNLEEGDLPTPQADLAWHVRAWGRWVLERARTDLAGMYPIIDGKPTVAYLWARTVECASCRAKIPLLKTRWLCKKENYRVVLTMTPNTDKTAVDFGIDLNPAQVGGNTAQRREYDKKLGAGTMTRVGATCPCCNLPAMEMAKIRRAGQDKKLGAVMTAVVVDGKGGKEYRLPTRLELDAIETTEEQLKELYKDIPFGLPDEPTPVGGGRGASRAFSVQGYGLMRWRDLFTARQLFALGTFVKHIRRTREALLEAGYPADWVEAIGSMLQVGLNRLLDFANCGVQWKVDVPTINHSFVRFALPITWDYAEGGVLSKTAGSFIICLDRIASALDSLMKWSLSGSEPRVTCASAKTVHDGQYDVIVTDPPYYDAIPYSDLMDFFYVWTRRGWMERAEEFQQPLAPKWSKEQNDGELIDDASRHGGDSAASKAAYEDGMADAFRRCASALTPEGLLVIVFANKQPDAWEALVAALVKSGFVVDGSWPIQTEQTSRMRAQTSAALASSVWLVCRKRPETACPGWDNKVLEEMRERIEIRLRDYWDAGIRGPDFVWAATGPAMEAYSKHPVVKKANDPGRLMDVGEFLRHVRRIVVDFVVGRVLSHGADGQAQDVSALDDPTTYYLLHRYDFKMEDAPAGPCILYAVSCNLDITDLADQYDMLVRTGKASDEDEDDTEEPIDAPDEPDAADEKGSGSKVKLKPWNQRRRPGMGFDPSTDSTRARRAAQQPALYDGVDPAIRSREVPMIDKVHRLMHLWRAGDVVKVDEYIDSKGIRKNPLFSQLLQALIELAPAGSEERSLMEAISNHLAARGAAPDSLYDRATS